MPDTPSRNAPSALVLVVEDDPDTAALEKLWLENEGLSVETFEDAESCLEALSLSVPDLICVDLDLPGMGGLEALERVLGRYPRLPVVILTATRDVEVVVRAIHRGAYDYLTKPIDRTRLTTTVRNALERSRMTRRLRELERVSDGSDEYEGIVGRSLPMRRLFAALDHVSTSDIAVLVQGESGTGKELVARALHRQSGRAEAPFVAVNCAAIPEALMESEFFGHERGAFTGAQAVHRGYFEQADGGTLFLDEVAELAPPLQAKLLRALQERRFTRVGGTREIEVDFRLVAASHRDLWDEVQAQRFREDLYYRIAVFDLELPPLRERFGDVPLLTERLLRRLAPKRTIEVSDEAMAMLAEHPFPGNVRELENALHRALVVCEDERIELHDLPRRVRSTIAPIRSGSKHATLPPPHMLSPRIAAPRAVSAGTLEEIERLALEQALRRHEGNVTAVVRELGIGRTTVYRKLKKYGLR